MHLSEIYCYPIKSARGHQLRSAHADRFGLRGDRRWLLIDDEGQFYSQRRLPEMALLDVEALADGLRLSFAGESIVVQLPDASAERVPATVWEHSLLAPVACTSVNQWISRLFGESMRLVYCPDDAERAVDADYTPGSREAPGTEASPGDMPLQRLVAFADGFPLLVISQASLDALNARLTVPVPMDRFRPNLVIDGAQAYAEDHWQRLRIGSTVVSLVKPCSRCAIPGIDQQTGQRDPLINRALAQYRRRDGVIYFGMNALTTPGARFALGDTVQVVD